MSSTPMYCSTCVCKFLSGNIHMMHRYLLCCYRPVRHTSTDWSGIDPTRTSHYISVFYTKHDQLHCTDNWWALYGYKTPHLQAMARRVLNLTCTASQLEKCWNTFNKVSTLYCNRTPLPTGIMQVHNFLLIESQAQFIFSCVYPFYNLYIYFPGELHFTLVVGLLG